MIAQNRSKKKSQQLQLQQQSIPELLNTFIDAICSQQSLENKIYIISKIKQSIINNPNNYYHPYYQRITFVDIYQFVIQCLSHQHQPALLGYLLHVLALMVKNWILDPLNIKKLYDGILQLFQQRTFCGQNCFLFLTTLIQTMQDYVLYFNQDNQINTININYSNIPVLKSTLENYFVYHLLNQLLAFANIFLERSVVRNQQISQNSHNNNNRKAQDQGRLRVSQSFNSSSNSRIDTSNFRQNSITSDISQQYQLYKLQQSESVIHSILSLIRACLSYDFSHTSRHQPQSQYQASKSPIILPTKYSKYCRFSEYDILLKNQTTTQLLNYLFLVCNSVQLKLQILKIIQSMARIHFRYFKTKTTHKVHLEDIGYVVANLLTGLDLNQPINNTNYISVIKQNTKVSIALGLGQVVSLLLYHQPTFYLVQYSLMEMIIEHIEVFILNELLDPDNFKEPTLQNYTNTNKPSNKFINSNKISKTDLCLLIQTYISPLYKLKDYIKNYFPQSKFFSQKINQLFTKIGQKYFQMLTIHLLQPQIQQNKIKKQQNCIQQQQITSSLQQKQISKTSQNNQKQFWNTNNDINENIHQIYRIENPPNQQLQNQNNQMAININIIDQQNQSSKQNEDKQQQTQINANLHQNNKNHPPHGFIQSIIQEQDNITSISNLLCIFRVYCPKHKYITVYQDEIANQDKNIVNNMSFKSLYLDHNYQSQIIKGNPSNNQDSNNNLLNNLSNKIIIKSNHQFDNNQILHTSKNVLEYDQNINTNMVDNYRYWLISWLCNFQNLFHITAGHCRHSKDWEIQIKMQFMIQLIQDLNNVINIYNTHKNKNNHTNTYNNNNNPQLQDKVQLEQLGKYISICLSFMVDKITSQCRVPSQQYMCNIHIDIISIIQFMIYNHFLSSQIENEHNNNNIHDKHQQLPIQPIIDVLSNVNTYTYISKGYLQTIAISNNGNQTQTKIQKVLQIKYRCINIIGVIGKILHSYDIVDTQCISLISPIIFLVMKVYVNNQQISDSFINSNCSRHNSIYNNIDNNKDIQSTNDNCKDSQLHQHLQHIFSHNPLQSQQQNRSNNQQKVQSLQLWPLFLMNGIVQQIHKNIINSPHYHSNSKYAYNDMMSIYHIQQTYAHEIIINYMHWMQHKCKNNHKYLDTQPELQWPDHYLALLSLCIPIVQLQKKNQSYHSSISNQQQKKKYSLEQIYGCSLKVIGHCWKILKEFDKINNNGNFQDNCLCFQYTSNIIKLYSELNGIDQKLSYLQSNTIQLSQLLQYIIKHRQCLIKQQYSKIIPYIKSFIKIIHLSNNGNDNHWDDTTNIIKQIQTQYNNQHNIYHYHLVNVNIYVIKIVSYFIFLLQLLSDLHTQYNNVNNSSSNNYKQLYKLQQCILHNIITYHHKNNPFNNSRTISGIIQVLQNVYINVNGTNQYQQNHIGSQYNNNNQLSLFIAETVKCNTQLLLSKLIQYLQSNMIETLYIPVTNQHDQYKAATFQKHTTLKIDNIIQVFTRNHILLQLLYQRYKTLLQNNINNEIILQCIKYNEEKGVAWVINKLELWNNEQLCHLETENSKNESQNNLSSNQVNNQTNQFVNHQQQHNSPQLSIPSYQQYNSPINIHLSQNKKTKLSKDIAQDNQQQQQKINNDYIQRYINNIINTNEYNNIFINTNINNSNHPNEILHSDKLNSSLKQPTHQPNNSGSQTNLNNPQYLDTNNQIHQQTLYEHKLQQYQNQQINHDNNVNLVNTEVNYNKYEQC